MTHNNNPKRLMVMSMGLLSKDGKRKLADFDSSDVVYNTLPDKSQYNPTVPMIHAEVKRRGETFSLTVASSQMSRVTGIKWLTENPLDDIFDVDWLQQEEAHIYNAASKLIVENAEAAASRLRNTNWNSHKPWIHLHLCACSDRARTALAARNRTLDRQELDAGDSTERPDNFEEIVAELYNDEDVAMVTESIPSLHSLFREQMTLRFSDMPGGDITSEDVKSRRGDARAKLIQVLVKI